MNEPIRPYPADDHDHHDDLNNLGLQADTNMLARSVLDRRHVLGLGLLGIGLLASNRVSAATGAATGTSAACTPIPSETAGPYPADGSVASGQSLNVLTRRGVVRRDLRRSLGTGNVAPGVRLTLTLKLVNTNGSCAPLRGYAVYAWHCTADGNYSMYSAPIVGEDYLRGVQVSDAGGNVTFQTVVPGCYPGRWPHIHFEVYPTLASATNARNRIQTSQLALPQAMCQQTYTQAAYGSSARFLSQTSLSRDNIFSDGYAAQLPTVTGNATKGYSATLTVGLAR